jgi:hypothetical protein
MTWNVLKILASAAEYGLALACGAAVGDTTAVQTANSLIFVDKISYIDI